MASETRPSSMPRAVQCSSTAFRPGSSATARLRSLASDELSDQASQAPSGTGSSLRVLATMASHGSLPPAISPRAPGEAAVASSRSTSECVASRITAEPRILAMASAEVSSWPPRLP